MIQRRLNADDLAAMRGSPKAEDVPALLDEVEYTDSALGECWTLLHEMHESDRPLSGGLRLRIRELLCEQGCPGYGDTTTIRTEEAVR